MEILALCGLCVVVIVFILLDFFHVLGLRGCDVLIATPGRLTDMYEPGHPVK